MISLIQHSPKELETIVYNCFHFAKPKFKMRPDIDIRLNITRNNPKRAISPGNVELSASESINDANRKVYEDVFYVINLYTHYRRKRFGLRTILMTLCHEMAHIMQYEQRLHLNISGNHWEHIDIDNNDQLSDSNWYDYNNQPSEKQANEWGLYVADDFISRNLTIMDHLRNIFVYRLDCSVTGGQIK